jgi:pyruvate, orthophosphate dikinase
MSVSAGVLTTRGGLVSHAAVVARGWGLPAVVGAHTLTITGTEVRDGSGAVLFTEGDTITIDGATGEVWRGDTTTPADLTDPGSVLARSLPELTHLG